MFNVPGLSVSRKEYPVSLLVVAVQTVWTTRVNWTQPISTAVLARDNIIESFVKKGLL